MILVRVYNMGNMIINKTSIVFLLSHLYISINIKENHPFRHSVVLLHLNLVKYKIWKKLQTYHGIFRKGYFKQLFPCCCIWTDRGY